MTGWSRKALSEVCKIDKSQGNHKGLPYVGMEDVESHTGRFLGTLDPQPVKSSTFKFNDGHVLYGRLRPYLNKVLVPDFSGHCSTEIFPLKPNPELDKSFVFYWLTMGNTVEQINRTCTGARMPRANMNEVMTFQIPLPSLPEQKRIVAILDEAFSGIDAAIANTEKNRANARELFESYLNVLSFEKQPLGSLVEIKTGKLNANAAVEGGEYPFFTCSREVYEIDSYAFDCEAILLSGNNASGDFNVKHYNGKFNAYQRTYVITIRDSNKLRYRYLYYQMIKSLKELKSSSVGVGTKFLKLGMIENLPIALPPIEEQQAILENLDELFSESERLQTIYRQKLKALSELKQSILNKAFAGEFFSTPEKQLEEAM